jgi:hypothetical protein
VSINTEARMRRFARTIVVFCCASCLPAAAHAQSRCTRAGLQSAVTRYLAAQAQGSSSSLPLTPSTTYVENMIGTAMTKGILQVPLRIDFHRSLLDTAACETFTEVIVTDASHPYVLGVRLKVVGDTIAEVETIVTHEGDWLFNAENYLKYSRAEDWSVIPQETRDTRAALLAAASAYEDIFYDNKVAVPWGTPCNRLEGGVRTGKGQPDDSCNVGVPTGIRLADRRFVADPDIGTVVALLRFGENRLPDSHLFRVENGRIRFVHTLTVCTIPYCGFPVRAPAGQ